MLVPGFPGSKKWPLDLASAIAMSTAILIYDVLNRVSDSGDCSKLCCWMVCFKIICLDANGLVVVSMVGVYLSTDASSVSVSVSLVLSSN